MAAPLFSKMLIANRGEIAVRIMATAHDLGISTVSVAPPDDQSSQHVARADEHVTLTGEGPAAYLDTAAIVAAAISAGCDAVHPGYGFASELPGFATACDEAGLTFVGPSAESLAILGDKMAAIGSARKLGVTVARSSAINDVAALAKVQAEIGGPLMLKAVSGGGGRGMRPVEIGDDLEQAIDRCRSEAARSFGDDSLYAEELIRPARHIEVQIIGDGGAVLVLGDRECSLQRQRQKVLEFAPAFGVDEQTRSRMWRAAVEMASAIGYRGLATFEFLVGSDGTPRFMEANARLQVEHTVTEAVTGLDLVEMQLRTAAGETLPDLGLEQGDWVAVTGVAVQARVNTERMSTEGDVTPTGGTIDAFTMPAGRGVRVDTYGQRGYTTNPRYDSLLAKIIVHGDSREHALRRLGRALAQTEVDGVTTNLGFLAALAATPEVSAGALDTQLIERLLPSLSLDEPGPAAPQAQGTASDGLIIAAPLQGTIIDVSVRAGDEVAAGTQLLVMEAMKMEHVVVAPTAGVIASVTTQVGDTTFEGHELMVLTPGVVAESDQSDVAEAVDPDHIRADLAESIDRHEIGLDQRRPEATEKRRRLGRRTARENLADLVDEGSFLEYGALAIAPQRRRRSLQELIEKTPADGMIAGVARVNGDVHGARARCAVVSYDYTVLAGTQGGQNHRKKDRLFELTERLRLPVVLFAEGGGGRPGDTDGLVVAGLDGPAFALFGALSGLVPLVGINTGYCFAGNAALLGMCDVIIATRDSNVGMGGPAMIEGGGLGVYHPTEVGPADEQYSIGVIDLLVDTDVEAVAVAKKYLSFFQGSIDDWKAPDQRSLRHVVPENRLRVYEMREVIDVLADKGSILELRAGWGSGMITTLARIEGRPVGIIANNPMHLAGAIDSDAADKAARFMQLCDAHDLPIVLLCDTPGIMVGPEAERSGTVRHASRMFVVGAGIDVPFVTVVIRKGYGLGAQAMAGGGFKSPMLTVSWPTGEFGGMGLEGAVRLGYRNELEAIADPLERAEEFQKRVDRMYEIGKALNFASAYELDDVIDPADTRNWIARAFAMTPPAEVRDSKKRPNIDTW